MSALTLLNSLVVEPYANRQLRTTIYESAANIRAVCGELGCLSPHEENLLPAVRRTGERRRFFRASSSPTCAEPDSEFILLRQQGPHRGPRPITEMLVMFNGEIHRRNASTGEVSTVTLRFLCRLTLPILGLRAALPFTRPRNARALKSSGPIPTPQIFQGAA